MKILQPENWDQPKGYSNGIEASGRMIFVAGQIGWTPQQTMVSEELVEQVDQALQNIIAVLKVASAAPSHVTRLTWYVTDKKEYISSAKAIGAVYRKLFGAHYPAMTLVEVKSLLEDNAKVEIEATAVVS